ncbi:AraC family transcriptional regulator [Flavobacterium rakeshii]|uniref:helix-turn-helix domain-containing protein n=1 Tax=Flavobacterium rakeshii TaxID=1038845 RepID=UPI002E7B49F7|nr:AraC family transcriptional regulator [Flavobacterium rakeshii]MEE1900064.1 AraC family transcriptional regulator [Flavobacterium rakeshii]
MKITEIKSCYLGPDISPEQLIQEHFFLYLSKGKMEGYDGKYHYLKPGNHCLVRKNRLARYNKQKVNNEFEKVVIIFDEHFLKQFQKKYNYFPDKRNHAMDAFIPLDKNELLSNFLKSLNSYFTTSGSINDTFSDLKREELLLILLKQQPELTEVFFDFGVPGKIDIQEFMLKNYKFNVNISHFAYLTGRSLSSFKKDFKEVFKSSPNRWLVKRRLEEAKFLIERNNKKPSDIYFDLGFEDLSHFSYAFKKLFGISPSQLAEQHK